jgi:alkylhydroperoxidase family enzyme
MRFLLGKVIDVMEARLGASMEYLRYVLRVSKRAFLAFLGTALLDSYRSRMPRAARHIARIVATQADDCGPCVQICVNMARAEVVPTSIIHDALHARLDRLPADLADVHRYALAVCAWEGDLDEARERIRRKFGDEGVVDLALAIASARVFPVTKRALGYAQNCSLPPSRPEAPSEVRLAGC